MTTSAEFVSFACCVERKILLACGLLFALLSNGCALHKTPLPEVIKSDPTLEEIVDAINRNSDKIESLVSEDGTLGVSSTPWTAKCRLAYKRESKIRLVGSLNMVGPVVDFGSDGNLFWFWFKNQEPNQISFCKLSEYAESSMRDQIPVDPIWFPEALGVMRIDLSEVVEGPTVDRDNTIKLVLKKTRPEGDYYKYLYLEAKTAALQRQDIKNPVTNEILTVSCDEFQYDKEHEVVLPKKIAISRSMAKERFYIDLGTLQVNPADVTLTFSPPKPEELGAPLVDIGPNGKTENAVPQASSTSGSVAANLTGAEETQNSYEGTEHHSDSSGGWGTGDIPYSSLPQPDYTSIPTVPAFTENGMSGEEVPSSSSEPTLGSAYSENSATVQFNTVVLPDRN